MVAPASCLLRPVGVIGDLFTLLTQHDSPSNPLRYILGQDSSLLVVYNCTHIWVYRLESLHDSSSSSLRQSEPAYLQFRPISDRQVSSGGDGEEIGALCIIPIQPSSREGADAWSCIVVGDQNGQVHFFTTDLTLLARLTFHDAGVGVRRVRPLTGPVTRVKGHGAAAAAARVRHLMVLYEGSVCVLLHFPHLTDHLIKCKLYQAKVVASAEVVEAPPEMLDPKTVRKYAICDQPAAVDLDYIADRVTPDTFTHLMTASVLGGVRATPRQSAPSFTRFVVAGCDPYLGIYDEVDASGDQPSLTEVAHKYASRLKSSFLSSVPGASWLSGASAEPATLTPSQIYKEQKLNLRFGFSDHPRVTESLSASPVGNLVAVADNLSRVMVFNVKSGLLVRVFKGYRSARVGWYLSRGEGKGSSSPAGLFLVIHAVKRNLLEVWAMVYGPRVAAFNVDKNAILVQSSCFSEASQLCLLNPLDGSLSNLLVPHHFALSDKAGGARQKDSQISTQILQALSNPDILNQTYSEFVHDSFQQLRTAVFMKESLKVLISSPNADCEMCQIATEIINSHLDSTELDISSDPQKDSLKALADFVQLAAQSFRDIWSLLSFTESAVRISPMEVLSQLKSVSHVSDDDFQIKIFQLEPELPDNEPVTPVDAFLALNEFLESFEHELHAGMLKVPATLQDCDKDRLGKFLFAYALRGDVKVDSLSPLLDCYEPMSLLDVLLSHWLSQEKLLDKYQDSLQMLHLHSLVLYMLGRKAESADDSCWYKMVRQRLQSHTNVSAALAAAIMIRGLIINKLEASSPAKQVDDSPEEAMEEDMEEERNWLELDSDVEAFNLLIFRLEDCVLLAALNASSVHPARVSVHLILEQGKGALSEFVARWLIREGISSGAYLEPSRLPNSFHRAMLAGLQRKLPVSLDADHVCCQVAWLAFTHWNSNRNSGGRYLAQSLEYLLVIGSVAMRVGVAHLIWTKVLHQFVKGVYDLLNSASPVSDRLCERDLCLSVCMLPRVLRFAINVLDAIESADYSSPEPTSHNYEEHWVEAIGNQECIPELSLKQPRCNFMLVEHNRLLLDVLLILSRFPLDNVRPRDVFDEVSRYAFKQPLHSYPVLSSVQNSQVLTANRMRFIEMAFLASLNDSEHDWSTMIYGIGSHFDVDPDTIRQLHVTSLFWLALDQKGHEMASRVSDGPNLSFRLMEIAAARLSDQIASVSADAGTPASVQSQISPTLAMWLETNQPSKLHSAINQTSGSLPDLSRLVELVMGLLPASHSLHAICEAVMDTIALLASSGKT